MEALNVNTTLLEKYKIIESIVQDKNQIVYLAKDLKNDTEVIVNQVNRILLWDLEGNNSRTTGILDITTGEDCSYLISMLADGQSLKESVATQQLGLKDRLGLLINLLEVYQTLPIDMPYDMKYRVMNVNNIMLSENSLRFNYILLAGEDDNPYTEKDIMSNVGRIIYYVFSGREFTTATDYSDIPPDIARIIKHIFSDIPYYGSITEIHEELKSTTLFQLFNEKQGTGYISKREQESVIDLSPKTRKINKLRLAIVSIGALAIIAFLYLVFTSGVIGNLFKDKDKPVIVEKPKEDNKANSKPIAKFSRNIHQIHVGDTVTFKSESTDPDFNDSIVAYAWLLSKESVTVTTSTELFFDYTFNNPGTYKLTLTAMDSKDAWSDPYIEEIVVLKAEDNSTGPIKLGYNQNFEPSEHNNKIPPQWSGIGHKTMEYDSSYNYKGSHSLKVAAQNNSKEFGTKVTFNLSTDEYGFFKGQSSIASAWVMTRDNGLKAYIHTRFLDSSGNLISVKSETPKSITSTWSMLSSNFRVPTNCSNLEIRIIIEGNGTVWIDNFDLDLIK